MSACLMENDASESVLDGDGHLPCLDVVRTQVRDGLRGSDSPDLFRFVRVEELHAHASARAEESALFFIFQGCDGGDGHTRPGHAVLRIKAFRIGNQESPVHSEERTGDLRDQSIVSQRGFAADFQERDPVFQGNVVGQDRDFMDVGKYVSCQANGHVRRDRSDRIGYVLRTAQKPRAGQVRGGGIGCPRAQKSADADACVDTVADLVDLLVQITDRIASCAFSENFREIRTGRRSLGQDFFK